MTKKKNFYSPEFKTQAISLVREAKRSGAEVAKELGINVNGDHSKPRAKLFFSILCRCKIYLPIIQCLP
jgi:hypothetical protein